LLDYIVVPFSVSWLMSVLQSNVSTFWEAEEQRQVFWEIQDSV